jgi:hypothetical protein
MGWWSAASLYHLDASILLFGNRRGEILCIRFGIASVSAQEGGFLDLMDTVPDPTPLRNLLGQSRGVELKWNTHLTMEDSCAGTS